MLLKIQAYWHVSERFWSTKYSTKVEIHLPSDTEWHLRRRQPYDKVSMNVSLTLYLLTWRIWWAPNNASRWQMGFNSAFKGLIWRPQVLGYKQPTRCNNNNFINNFNQLNMFRPSSGALDCVYNLWYTALTTLPASDQDEVDLVTSRQHRRWIITQAVNTV